MSKPKISKNIIIPEDFLKELLTSSEIRMLKNRWQIIQLLKEGLSVRVIAAKIGVGTDTVVRVKKMMESKAFIFNEEPKSSRTPWVFGKSE